MDVWDPREVLDLMLQEHLSAAGGAPYFLTSLLDHPDLTDEHLEHLEFQGMGGAPVPRALAERATELGIVVFRAYGSTEHPSITGSSYADAPEKRLRTDGRPLLGVEVRLVDPTGREVDPGEPGEILSRGPDWFLGYTDAALTARAVDADGWYHTGDVGISDEDGYILITDRISDVIIRGGENISAAEIEELLLVMPGVGEVAVVAAPDARTGEHATAVIRMLRRPAGSRAPARSAPTSRRPDWPGRSGPRRCWSWTSSPAPPPGRSRRTCSGSGCGHGEPAPARRRPDPPDPEETTVLTRAAVLFEAPGKVGGRRARARGAPSGRAPDQDGGRRSLPLRRPHPAG